MRLNTIVEGLGTVEYQPPNSAAQMMADFYMLSFLESGTTHTPGERTTELDNEVKQMRATLIPHLRNHLLGEVGFSISTEVGFMFTKQVAKPKTPEIKTVTDKAKYLESLGVNMAVVGLLISMLQHYGIGAGIDDEVIPDQTQLLTAYRQLATAGLTLFDREASAINWARLYAGIPWVNAAQTWLDLYKAKDLNTASVYIDRVYDLQHNTGAVLDKNPEYQDEDTGKVASWVKSLLDLKRDATDPEQLIPYTSPVARRLAHYILHNRYGRGWDTDKYGETGPRDFPKSPAIPQNNTLGAAEPDDNQKIGMLASNLVDILRTKLNGYNTFPMGIAGGMALQIFKVNKPLEILIGEIRIYKDKLEINTDPMVKDGKLVTAAWEQTQEVILMPGAWHNILKKPEQFKQLADQLIDLLKTAPIPDLTPPKKTKKSPKKKYDI